MADVFGEVFGGVFQEVFGALLPAQNSAAVAGKSAKGLSSRGGRFKVITPPTQVITLADLREHLRVEEVAPAQDALIIAQLDAARDYAQHYTGAAIGSQTIEIALDCFPENGILLAPGPVNSITSIKYIDGTGAEQTIANTQYTLDDYGIKHWALPKAGTSWPTPLDAANSVKVRYVAGTLVPAVRSALLLLVGELFANREQTTAKEMGEVPIGVKHLLDTVKIWSF